MSVLARSIEKLYNDGVLEGVEKGELLDKQKVLIRQADRKFGVSEPDKEYIISITNSKKLDAALDAVITAETLDEVLSELK